MEKDYIFASSRVRSVEKNLLTREKLEKMIESKTPAEALKVLYDSDYGNGAEMVREEHFEELLSEESRKTYEFILSIAPDEADFRTFLYPYDYHNLKTLLKAEFQETDASPFLFEIGAIDPKKLSVMVRERNFLGMTSHMKNALLEAVDVFSRTSDPQAIDLIFDQACYLDMRQAAEETGSTFVMGYVRTLVDTINLKTFVRLRQMGKGWDFFQKVYIPGGQIPEKLFIASYDEPYEQFAEKLLPFGLQAAMAEGAAMLRETGRFTALEKACDDRLTAYAREAKYVSFGIEPLAAYLIAKETEIRTARIIMAGVLQGLSREMIRERLRETYV